MLSSPVLERLLCLRIPILTPSSSSHTHCSARPPTSPLAPPCTLVHLPPAQLGSIGPRKKSLQVSNATKVTEEMCNGKKVVRDHDEAAATAPAAAPAASPACCSVNLVQTEATLVGSEAAPAVLGLAEQRSLDLSVHLDRSLDLSMHLDRSLCTTCTLNTCTGLAAISISAKLFAITMSFLSGFLGGLCGISGPPIMMFFLHAGHFDFVFTKASQRATGAAITFCNRAMRVLFYAVASADGFSSHYFDGDDYPMYISIAICSFAGVWLGQKLFERMKDSQATKRRSRASNPDPDPLLRPLTLTLALTVTLT